MSKKEELMTPEHKAEMAKIRETATASALEVVKVIMPRKVIELTELIQSPELNVAPKDVPVAVIEEVAVEDEEKDNGAPSTKKRKAASGKAEEVSAETSKGHENGYKGVVTTKRAKVNPVLLKVLQILKKELVDFMDNVSRVKIWLQLNMPRIEDGNNFGVAILEEALTDLVRADETANTTLESCTKYHTTRAKWVTKHFKYPGIEDYERAIHEHDIKEYISFATSVTEIRNNYAIIHDMMSKNWDKIVRPRSESSMVY